MTGLEYGFFQEHAFAIVDRLQFPEDACPAGLQMEPLVPRRLEGSARMLPGLVSLGSLSDGLVAACLDLLAEQVTMGRPLFFSGLLKTAAPMEAVAQHFRSTLMVPAPDGELYLRQFDPRLFVQYDWLLTPPQRMRLFGPITGWTLHLDGEWRTFLPPSDAKPEVRWQLTAGQAARIEALQKINRAMASQPVGGIDLRRERVRNGYCMLERANQHGLSADRCLMRFLEHGWAIHPGFDQHPEVSSRLQRMLPSDDFPYLAATADLDDGDFARIRKDMAKGDSP